MHPHPSPSAHTCTPPAPRYKHKPRNYGSVIAGDGSDPLTGATKRDHHAQWRALTYAQQEALARDQLLAMLDHAPWNSPEFLALSHAAAVLTVKIKDRGQAQGGAV